MEEYIEKEKVLMFFNWFKRHNHLYKDIEFDVSEMEQFVHDSVSDLKDFEGITIEEIITYMKLKSKMKQ